MGRRAARDVNADAMKMAILWTPIEDLLASSSWSTAIAEGTGAGGEGGFAELWGNASSVEADVGSSLVGRSL
jgi:hypothetical protein